MKDGMPSLKILHVEDLEMDALRLKRHLQKGGIPCVITRATTEQEFNAALSIGDWDLVLTDYVLPGFTGLSVIQQLRDKYPEIPCIVVSGQVGDDYAVEAFHRGAKDFISKSRLARLIPAIEREIKSKEERKTARLSKTHFLEIETKFKAISEAAQDAIILTDTHGCAIFWNPAAERIFGYSSDEILGRNLNDILVQEGAEKPFKRGSPLLVQTDEKNSGKTLQLPALTKNGQEIHVELSLSSVRFEEKWYGISILRDVTNRLSLESQLRQAQKLEAIGQLAAGIAHEINTPIQYIGDNAIFLREVCQRLLAYLSDVQKLLPLCELPAADSTAWKKRTDALKLDYLQREIPKAIQESLDGVLRVSKIVSAMKDFSHPSMGVKALADLNHAIESTTTVCRNEWKYKADLELDLDPALPLTPCVVDEFNQVVLNLVINAVHAIESAVEQKTGNERGLIRISTRSQCGHIEIRISDTGTGIPESHLSRIFDPFFTTKPIGKGTGQGLSIAHAVIVEKLGGTIQVETELGKGTTFILTLPMNPERGVE